MLTNDAIKHFGGVAALSKALQISRAAVYQWGETVPELSAYKLQDITQGALRVRSEDERQGVS